jgi:hypothetical protein
MYISGLNGIQNQSSAPLKKGHKRKTKKEHGIQYTTAARSANVQGGHCCFHGYYKGFKSNQMAYKTLASSLPRDLKSSVSPD